MDNRAMDRMFFSSKSQGFTLIELMITLAVAAILLTYGIPSFLNAIENSRRTAIVNDLVSSLHFARSEAFKRNKTVSICPSKDGQQCGGDWKDGWIVFVNEDADVPESVDADEQILRRQIPGSPYSLKSDRILRNGISFSPRGRSRVTGVFAYCDKRGAAYSRNISMNVAGRVLLEEGDAGGIC